MFRMRRKTTAGERDERWPAPRSPFCLAMGTAAILLSVVASGCKNPFAPGEPNAVPPIPTVRIARVVQKDVPIFEEAIGTTVGFVNAQILPKVSGYLVRQDYKDGSRVRAGQLLFEIDPRQYQAALDQALGELARAQAQLKQNQLTLGRYTQLYKDSVVAKQTFDDITQTTRAS